MGILEELKYMLAELLDMDDLEITPETYIVRDLGAESIDLLELAVSLNTRYNIEVNDGEIFLTRLRAYVLEAESKEEEVVPYLLERLPFLSENRVREILEDLELGPTLKVKDVISYIQWASDNGRQYTQCAR